MPSIRPSLPSLPKFLREYFLKLIFILNNNKKENFKKNGQNLMRKYYFKFSYKKRQFIRGKISYRPSGLGQSYSYGLIVNHLFKALCNLKNNFSSFLECREHCGSGNFLI
jgi:hypothetical protein